MVLMDELCSGTNPSEGERIFQMVLDLFEELRPQVLISTHFLDFAERLCEERGDKLAFLQVEMDAEEHPTYQFIPGVAKTSLARNTAARLGVTREELLALVRKHQR
jgi:DNA mismatch repair protein MutS2